MAKDTHSAGPTPIISRVLADGAAIETLHDAEAGITRLAICTPSGSIAITDHYDLPTKERLVPYAASNNLLASGCVLLPSAVGDLGSKAILIADVRAFIHRYVDLSPLYEDIAAHYVLLTWVHDVPLLSERNTPPREGSTGGTTPCSPPRPNPRPGPALLHQL